MLALTDQPDNKALVREVYGDRVAYVPYTIPGFALAKSVADVFDKNPGVEGLVLLQHGIFTVGDTAEQAYGRMIEFVTMAEERLGRQRKTAGPGQAARQDRLACRRSRPSCAARWRSRKTPWPAPPSGRSWISAPMPRF